ncbi:MAG TPA: hypothetical protein DDW52_01270 [Planctomycetaceae bacterium]|nr:hypothetical protein [Planctomycetaceae bacterium]
MWKKLHQSPPETDALRFRTGLALASLYPDSNKWRDSDFEFLSKHLVENLSNDRDWATNFRDIAPECSVFWRNTFLAAGSQLLGQNAAVLLAHFESNSPEQMASMLVSATPQQYQIVFDPVLDNPSREYRNAVVAFLSRVASENPPNGLPEAERIRHGKRRANAGITLLRLNEPELALTSLEIQDDPESITQFIHGCVSRKVEASLLLECFDKVQASTQLQQNATIRHALLLALGEYELSKFGAEKERLSQQIVSLYRDDPSSAVHGAARWVLYKWQRTKEIVAIDRTEREYSPQREWFVKKLELPRNAGETFLTFVVFKPGKFDVGAIPGEHDISSEDDPLERALLNEYGSPGDEAPLEFEAFESRHPTEISRPFAILDREVYHREVKSFKPDHAKLMRIYQASNDVDPAPGLMWYDAVDFCRSMNEQLGIPEDQQPHTIASTNGSEMKSGAGEDASNSSEAWLIHQERRGLRLPTEAEWEVACRAGARTPFGHGSDEALLAEYAWLGINSRKDIHLPKTRKPNLRGLFDMHGNLFEWTYDRRAKYPNPVPTDYTGSPTGKVRVLRGGCWGVMPYLARSAFRMGTAPDFSFVFMGIRPAMTLPSDAEFAGGLDKSDSLVRAQ